MSADIYDGFELWDAKEDDEWSAALSLTVHVEDLRFELKCDGQQPMRWLALSAAQRYLQRQPHGRLRRTEGSVYGGCVPPSEVVDAQGRPLDPAKLIGDAFRSGDSATVRLVATHEPRKAWRPARALQQCGFALPHASAFEEEAFYHKGQSPSAWRRTHEAREALLTQRYQSAVPQPGARHAMGGGAAAAALTRHGYFARTDEDKARVRVRLWDEAAMATEELHNARKSEGQKLKDNVHAADFRLMMRNQQLFHNTFQLMDEAERAAGVRLVLQRALGKIALPSMGADEADALRDALAQHLPALNVIFKYYCAFSRGGNVSAVGGSTATMSFVEFQAFARHCGIFRGHATLKEGFDKADEDTATKRDPLARNPEHELLRFEFLECVISLARVCYPEGSLASALASTCGKHIVPKCDAIIKEDNMVRSCLANQQVQVLLDEACDHMRAVFQHYSRSGHAKEAANADHYYDQHRRQSAAADLFDAKEERHFGFSNAMDIVEFTALLRDAVLIGAPAPSEALEDLGARADISTGYKTGVSAMMDDPAVPFHASVGADRLRQANLTDQEVRVAFSCAQGDNDEELWELDQLDFCEFCEALVRIALAKYEDPRITTVEKVRFVVEAVTRMNKGSAREVFMAGAQKLLPVIWFMPGNKGKQQKQPA
jgi:hypothetical protein